MNKKIAGLVLVFILFLSTAYSQNNNPGSGKSNLTISSRLSEIIKNNKINFFNGIPVDEIKILSNDVLMIRTEKKIIYYNINAITSFYLDGIILVVSFQ